MKYGVAGHVHRSTSCGDKGVTSKIAANGKTAQREAARFLSLPV